MNALISVIVPAYNAEQYIEECIVSVISKVTYPLEVIIIDDSSTDRTYNLCKMISNREDNILVCKIPHSGVSAARNEGLRIAKGKYVVFCDADDTLVASSLDSMVHYLDSCESIDLVVGNVMKRNTPLIIKNETISADSAIKRFYSNDDSRLLGTVYGKMFRRDTISSLRFNENISVGEDSLFLLSYLIKSNEIIFSTDLIYVHRINPLGVISSKHIHQYITALDASSIMIEHISKSKPLLLHDAYWDLFSVYKHLMNIFSKKEDRYLIISKTKSIISSHKLPHSFLECCGCIELID